MHKRWAIQPRRTRGRIWRRRERNEKSRRRTNINDKSKYIPEYEQVSNSEN